MKLIKPSFEIWEQPKGLQGIYEQIERVGRVCYKSEDKIRHRWYSEDKSRWINEDSAEYELMKSDYPVRGESLTAKAFVDRMIASKHYAMLEHGTIYLRIIIPRKAWNRGIINKYHQNKYSKVNNTFDEYDYTYYITTNLRVLVENEWLDDLKYICEPTEHHKKRVCVHFVCDRGVSHEFVRHKILCVA